MKNLCFLFILLLNFIYAHAQDSTYYVGHSLVNLNMPFQTSAILDASNVANFYRHHINIGASLKLNWDGTSFNGNPIWDPSLNADVSFGTNHFMELQNSYNSIVLTEAVPLLNYSRDTTVKYASQFYNLAQTSNPNISKYLYATWEGDAANGLAWRNHIASLVSEWEDLADQCSSTTGGNSVYIVPGNLAMMALYDTLQLRNIGSFTTITDFFEPDGIHLNFNGNYLISCLMAAVVYHTNSFGLDAVDAGPYTNDMVILDDIARLEIQKIAVDVACSYGRTGLPGSFCNVNSNTYYVNDTIRTNDTVTIMDNTISSDSIYVESEDISVNTWYSQDTIFQTDSIHTIYHLLVADNSPTNIRESAGVTSYSIYPNPFESDVNIELVSKSNEIILVQVFSLDGKLLLSMNEQINTGLNVIKIAEMKKQSDGYYFVRISSERLNIFKKIIKSNN